MHKLGNRLKYEERTCTCWRTWHALPVSVCYCCVLSWPQLPTASSDLVIWPGHNAYPAICCIRLRDGPFLAPSRWQ